MVCFQRLGILIHPDSTFRLIHLIRLMLDAFFFVVPILFAHLLRRANANFPLWSRPKFDIVPGSLWLFFWVPGTVSDYQGRFLTIRDGFWLYFPPFSSLFWWYFSQFSPDPSFWTRSGSCLRRVQMRLPEKREGWRSQAGIWRVK